MRNEEETTDNSDVHDGTRPADTTPFSDPFFKMCFNIAVYLTRRKYGQATSWNDYGEKMEQLTKNMLVKHEIAFRTMGERLNLTPSSICGSFESVARQTFLEGCNFGRIVAVYAFFVTVLEYCIQNGMENKVEELRKITANIVAEHKDWVNTNGGWVRRMNQTLFNLSINNTQFAYQRTALSKQENFLLTTGLCKGSRKKHALC